MKRIFAILCLLLLPSLALATPPTQIDSNSGNEPANTTTHTVTLPTTVYSGALLVCWMGFDGNPTITWDNSTAGTWSTAYVDTVTASSSNKLYVIAKVADGTEGAAALSISTSASEQSVFRCASYQDWEGTLAGGLNIPAAATGTSTTPNPPAATDSWGSVDRKTIAVYAADGARTVSAYPSTYTLNQFSDSSGGGAGVGLGSAGLNSTPGTSQDPGTFTISASDQWAAATISIKGGSAGGPPASTCTRGGLSLLGVGC